MFTPANVDDRLTIKQKKFHDKLFGNFFGYKGCIGKDLFEKLFVVSIHLVTKVRKNMKNKPMSFMDKIVLRKRAIIEKVNDLLKKQLPN